MTVPPPLEAFPLVDDWLSFAADGIDLRSGRVEFGQGIATALIQMAADELDVPMTAVRLTQGHTGRVPAEGPTVGSLSVSFGGQAIRLAASAARALMLRRAASLLQAGPGDLEVADGAILKGGLDTGLSYAGLAGEVDLHVPVMDHAAPKAAADRRLAGRSAERVDLAARMAPGYLLHDIDLDGMWHGRTIQPPDLGATLPETLPGACGGARLLRDGRFLAVVAQDEWTALSEARRLAGEIDWTPGSVGETHPVDALEGEIAEVETLHDSDGLEAGIAEVSVTLTRPVSAHGSIGPSCAVARLTDGRLTVWAHSQNVFALRTSLSRVLRLAEADVEVIFAPGSGCYGHNSSDDVAIEAALMARLSGHPVRALWQRRDELQHGPLAPAMRTQMTARLDEGGRIVSFDARVVTPPHSTRPGGTEAPNMRAAALVSGGIPMGAGSDPVQPQGGGDRNAVPSYAIPAVRVVRVRPAIVPFRPSAMRGLGAFANVIALESLMDGCAEAAGADPVDYRLRHLDDPRARTVIEAAREIAGAAEEAEDAGRALGYARYKNSAGYVACVARVVVGDEVRVTDVWTAADIGEAINPDGAINQIEGGIVQAISWTLKEEVPFAGGRNLAEGWEDYPILRFGEIPRLRTRLIGPQDAPPLGAGEISGGPAGAAVVGAVRRVLGVRPDRLPLTRHALVALLS